jgi:hypothetical protein
MKKSEKRTRLDREQWRTLVSEWRSSGTKAQEFARTRGLKPANLYYWSSVLARAAEPAPVPKLLPVRVTPQVSRSPAVELAVGPTRIRFEAGTSPSYVAALARALLEATTR